MTDVVNNTTSDKTGKNITNEIEVDKDEVEIFSIEELAPSDTPITVPYLEIYRTNELEYVPYLSKYNVGIQSSDSSSDSSSSDSSSESSEGTEGTDGTTGTDGSTSGTDTGSGTGAS